MARLLCTMKRFVTGRRNTKHSHFPVCSKLLFLRSSRQLFALQLLMFGTATFCLIVKSVKCLKNEFMDKFQNEVTSGFCLRIGKSGVQAMKQLPLYMVFLGLPMSAVQAGTQANAQASESPDQAYLAFQQARGEASWIASGSDHPLSNEVVRPIPPAESFSADAAKRQLGFDLFHDARLSADNTVACMSCHMGMTGGTDRRPVSIGINGQLGSVNAPTIFNAAFNFRQFWDGRAFDLDEQALGPLSNPVEMGHDLQAVVDFVANDPVYARQFDALYPDGVTINNIGNAIAQQSRNMIRSDSRFNAYLNGDQSALSEQEQRGWTRFQEVGCSSCHNGINLGGNSYQRLGNSADYFIKRVATEADDGLYARTQRESDRHVFKVPTLHNVALTPPYFHDGSVATLEEAVRRMGQLQLGRRLEKSDVADITAFLQSTSSQFFAGRGMGMMGGAMNQQGMQNQMRQRMQQMGQQGQQGQRSGVSGMNQQNDTMSHDAGHHQMMHSAHHGQSGGMMQ